ncbi:hypothetical protein [Nocardia brasiliensis]|uniref:hypothetical protein n=1 Tax=Nocardia brasiliensis TaxID=37326 RepID=UPI0004A74D54|nr:hypothetical protein [Nocardia brasiliensis]MBF6124050.1 hypothetical protein [Nocardia brasiliensis]MBF6543862.1 hypothetical protein [Nocardia brasiliensis]
MSAQLRVRSMIVALLGTFALACGVVAPGSAVAQPAPPAATQIDDSATESPDKKADKAEKLGGTVTTKVIDLVTGIVKCGLNIASPSVKCSI